MDERRRGWAAEVMGLVVLVAVIVLIPGASAAAGGSSHRLARSADRSAIVGQVPGPIHSLSMTR